MPAAAASEHAAPPRPSGVVARAMRTGRMRIGIGLTGLVLLVALAGPLVSPHSPVAFVDMAYASPSAVAWLGTDYVGRDVLSRVLHGGLSILTMTTLGVLLAMGGGVTVGLVAAYSGPRLDALLMRIMDVIFAIPNIVLILLSSRCSDRACRCWSCSWGWSGYHRSRASPAAVRCRW